MEALIAAELLPILRNVVVEEVQEPDAEGHAMYIAQLIYRHPAGHNSGVRLYLDNLDGHV